VKVRYSVTFEFEMRSPVTHRGTVAGSSGATCVARAGRLAQKALKPVNWSSMVVVLLERLDTDVQPTEAVSPEPEPDRPAAAP
jgi:hypothetical protein